MIESTALIKRCFPEIFEKNAKYYCQTDEKTNRLLIEKRRRKQPRKQFSVHYKTITELN